MRIFGLSPCREVGDIKERLKNAILDGDIPNEREAAYKLMLKVAAEMGLKQVEEWFWLLKSLFSTILEKKERKEYGYLKKKCDICIRICKRACSTAFEASVWIGKSIK